MNSQSVDQLVGSRIRVARLAMNVTEDQLASDLGISAMQLESFETGAEQVPGAVLVKIARRLKVTPSYFFDRTDWIDPKYERPNDTT